MKPKKVPGVPSQLKGGSHDTETKKILDNSELLNSEFQRIQKKFLDINSWSEYFEKGLPKFELHNSDGTPIQRSPQIGDYIKILLNTHSPKNYIWVRIDMIDYTNPDSLMIQIRPSTVPGQQFAGRIIHFFSSTSTSTFILSKGKDYIKAAVYGRNETANSNANFINSIKNIFISLSSKLGSSKINWKNFTDGILK